VLIHKAHLKLQQFGKIAKGKNFRHLHSTGWVREQSEVEGRVVGNGAVLSAVLEIMRIHEGISNPDDGRLSRPLF
jgi:hypothetical protein